MITLSLSFHASTLGRLMHILQGSNKDLKDYTYKVQRRVSGSIAQNRIDWDPPSCVHPWVPTSSEKSPLCLQSAWSQGWLPGYGLHYLSVVQGGPQT